MGALAARGLAKNARLEHEAGEFAKTFVGAGPTR
jgi:hypothetical protein